MDYLFDHGRRRLRPRDKRPGLLGELLDGSEVRPLLVESAGFELADELHLEVENASSFVALDRSETPYEEFPHLWLSAGDAEFTSLFLSLRKPLSSAIAPLPNAANLLGL